MATPAALVAGYAALARREGVELRRGCEVTAASVADGGGFSFVAGGERWECEWLVNAAGPWAAHVGALLGVDVPVSPVRRQFFTTEPLSWVPKKMPLTIDWGPASTCTPQRRDADRELGPRRAARVLTDPDLDYLAGVWEDATRRLPRVENAVMKT